MTSHYKKPPLHVKKLLLKDIVKKAVDDYFDNLQGEKPEGLYSLVLVEIEEPLLELTLKFCSHNQSRVAAILGINRGTFRKKLKFYGLLS